MFDLITGKAGHLPRRQTVPMILSVTAEVAAIDLIAAASMMVVADRVPEIDSIEPPSRP